MVVVVAVVDETVVGRLAAAAAVVDLSFGETVEASGPGFLGCHEPCKKYYGYCFSCTKL